MKKKEKFFLCLLVVVLAFFAPETALQMLEIIFA